MTVLRPMHRHTTYRRALGIDTERSEDRTSYRRGRSAAVAGLLLIIMLTGCSAGSSSSTSSSEAPAVDAVAGAQAPAAEPQLAVTESDQSSTPVGTDQLTINPQVIRTGDLRIEVKDLAASASTVRAQAVALGGFVANESTGYGEDAQSSDIASQRTEKVAAVKGQSVLVLRIPAAQFDDAYRQVAVVGTELSRSSSAQDVTADIADLTSRTATAKASVERVRALLAQAKSIQDIVALEAELTRREADLEALAARQKALSGQAALGTLTVVLQTPDVNDTGSGGSSFLAGLSAGWHALGSSATALLVVIGAALPFAVLIALTAWVVWTIRRRRSHDRGHTTAPPTAEAAAPTAADSERVH